MFRIEVGPPATLVDENDNVKGIAGPNYNQEHLFVFEGEAARAIAFDLVNPITGGIGVLRWNDTDGTLEFGLKGGNVTLQIGQEQNARFRNNTANDMLNGQIVFVSGSTGTHATISLAIANTDASSATIIGMLTEDIAKNTTGFVTTFGLVRDLDTSSLTEGSQVWLSPTIPGGMTTTKPVAPNYQVLVGYCVRSHNTQGAIFVKPQNGYALGDLHNVKLTSPQDGQVLKYQASTGLWVNATP